jgi:hypothetical protein
MYTKLLSGGSLLIFLAVFAGCSSRSVSTEELREFVIEPTNGIRKTVTVGDLTIEVLLRPTDLMVLQEVTADSSTRHRIEELRRKYDSYYYFLLSLSNKGKEALTPSSVGYDYGELVNVLSFRMVMYTNLTTSRLDTIPLAEAIMTPTYGMSRTTDLILVFNREKSIGVDWVQLNINEFGMGSGNQRFRFSLSDLDRIPKLKFDTLTE